MPETTTPPRVRPLEWIVDNPGPDETHHVRSVVGKYAAWVKGGKAFVLLPTSTGREEAGTTIEEARAAGQADFEARILGALDL